MRQEHANLQEFARRVGAVIIEGSHLELGVGFLLMSLLRTPDAIGYRIIGPLRLGARIDLVNSLLGDTRTIYAVETLTVIREAIEAVRAAAESRNIVAHAAFTVGEDSAYSDAHTRFRITRNGNIETAPIPNTELDETLEQIQRAQDLVMHARGMVALDNAKHEKRVDRQVERSPD